MGIKTAGKTFDMLASELGHEYRGSSGKWYSPAETTVLMRARLTETFPGIKIKGRTSVYSGGASFHGTYSGNFDQQEVRLAAGEFSAGTFNGMIDLYEYKRNELNGEPVHYGLSFVFIDKEG